MAQWKNIKTNPPPQGKWVMARHPYVPGTFQLDPAAIGGDMDMSNAEWFDWTVPDPVPLLIMLPWEFKRLFTALQFDAIRRSDDPGVRQLLDLVNSPNVTAIDLRTSVIIGGISYLQTVDAPAPYTGKILSAGEAARILAGTPPG